LNAGFPNWKACRAAVKNNSSDCTVLFIGESTFTGMGAFFSGTDMHSAAIANQLGTVLRSFGINAQNISLAGDSRAVSYSSFDARITPNNWTTSGNFTIGGKEWSATDGSAFVFNPTDPAYPRLAGVETDRIDIYWNGVPSGGGTIVVDTGGSPICTINTNTGTTKQFNKTTCSTTLGVHTYNLKCLAPLNCTFDILVARNSKIHEASIINGSANGTRIAEYNANTGSPWDPLPAIQKIAPKLCVIMLLGNDAYMQTPLPIYRAATTAVVNACKQSGDVLLMTGFPYGLNDSPHVVAGKRINIEQYQAAILAVAASTNVPVWDTLKTWGQTSGPGVTGWNSMGMSSGWNAACCGQKPDTSHWSVANNVYAATLMAMVLLQ
jgi:lysophospholipase L1-like esterase